MTIPPGTLRAELEARRARGEPFTLKEAIGVVVPLCTQLSQLHSEGKRFFVYPSVLDHGRAGTELIENLAHAPPQLPRDRACIAPEERKGQEGDSRGSVFSVGAILYEMLTGASVGPGMKRPGEVIPDLPEFLEVLLGKALVADAKHRPADLAALAQALHGICPSASMAPPFADESHLDHDENFEVDVSLSMIPPAPRAPGFGANGAPAIGDYGVAVAQVEPRARPRHDPTQQLADLKASLEADPRSRYVVVKDGMDHGPFTAVELLQQIATGAFHADDPLRDTISNDERLIREWEEFEPFAQQAKVNRDIVQEKKALDAVVHAEKTGMQYKALIGAAVIGLIAAAGLGYWARERANRERELAIQGDSADLVDSDAGLGSSKKQGGGAFVGGGAVAGGGGKFPSVAGGKSCESAIASYNEQYTIGGGEGKPDLTAGAYGNVLNRGSYLNACGVPSNMAVSVCAAVQNGQAVGVTVTTKPSNPGIASCIAGQVRALSFPAHPRMDVATTTFAPQ